MPDRRVLAAAAAFLLVASAVGGILVFGSIGYPDLPALDADPDPRVEGLVAFVRNEGRESCVVVVPAGGGQQRVLRCDRDMVGPVGWTEDGLVESSFGHGRAQRLVLDPSDGTVVRTEPSTGRGFSVGLDPRRTDGATLLAHRVNRTVELARVGPDGGEHVLARLEGPRDYAIWELGWSPDGRWALAVDSGQRLLLIDPQEGGARLLADSARNPVWFQGSTGQDPDRLGGVGGRGG